jgi:hypothetical protein
MKRAARSTGGMVAVAAVVAAVLVAAPRALAGDSPAVLLPSVPVTSSIGAPTSDDLKSIDAALARALADEQATPLSFVVEPAPRALSSSTTALRDRADDAAVQARTDEAVRLYRQLIDELQRDLATVGDVEPLQQARLALAGLYLGAGEAALAKSEFDAAARLAPARELDPRVFSPVVVEAFEEARARVLREPVAELTVASGPPGADVVVDGVPRGPSPQTIALPRGPHLLQLQRAGHAPLARVVDVVAGSRTRLDETLTPRPVFAAWQTAQATLRARGTKPGDLQALASLRDAVGAKTLFVPVVTVGADGPVVVLARVGVEIERVGLAGLGAVRAGDGKLVGDLVAALQAATPAAVNDIVAVQATGTLDVQATLRADFAARALGIADGVVVGAPSEPGLLSSPWAWGVAGVGVAVVGGAVAAAVVLLQPAPQRQAEPDQTQIVLTVVP